MQRKSSLSFWLTAPLLWLVALPALAQIALESQVQKVEHIEHDDGQVETRLVDADSVVPGDELRYTISFRNEGDEPIDPNSIVITDPLPRATRYIDGTAFGAGARVTYSVDRGQSFADPEALYVESNGTRRQATPEDYTAIRWEFEPGLEPGEASHVSFNVQLR